MTPAEDTQRFARIEREVTRYRDSAGQYIHRLDWVRFVYYDGGRGTCTVAGGEGPVLRHNGEMVVVQICPYDIILKPLSEIADGVALGAMDWWVEGWIDVVNAPKEPWGAFRRTGERPGWGKYSTEDSTL